MLILTRAKDQSVIIGSIGEICVSVLEIDKNYVRLGFEAPKNIPIHRSEVYQKIQSEEKVTS